MKYFLPFALLASLFFVASCGDPAPGDCDPDLFDCTPIEPEPTCDPEKYDCTPKEQEKDKNKDQNPPQDCDPQDESCTPDETPEAFVWDGVSVPTKEQMRSAGVIFPDDPAFTFSEEWAVPRSTQDEDTYNRLAQDMHNVANAFRDEVMLHIPFLELHMRPNTAIEEWIIDNERSIINRQHESITEWWRTTFRENVDQIVSHEYFCVTGAFALKDAEHRTMMYRYDGDQFRVYKSEGWKFICLSTPYGGAWVERSRWKNSIGNTQYVDDYGAIFHRDQSDGSCDADSSWILEIAVRNGGNRNDPKIYSPTQAYTVGTPEYEYSVDCP